MLLAVAGVIAKQARQERFLQSQRPVIASAVGRPEILQSQHRARGIEVLHRHPVLGEGAGFV